LRLALTNVQQHFESGTPLSADASAPVPR
jgi:hypothetical protein